MNIKIVIGLGNPDKKYKNTYHNVGHLFIDYLKNPLIAGGYTLLASNAYMNDSGRFVAQALKKHNIKPEELLIVHDDSDIEIGKYKLSYGRGAAGHHGVESIQQYIKTNNFWRLRIGIRPKADLPAEALPAGRQVARAKAEEFVLKKIPNGNKKILEETFQKITQELSKDSIA